MTSFTPTPLTRRALGSAMAGVLVAALGACGSSTDTTSTGAAGSAGAVPVTIKTTSAGSFSEVLNYVADGEGYFAKQGLKVTFVPSNGTGPQQAAFLASGEADILSMSPLNVFPLLSKGEKVRGFGSIWKQPLHGILFAKGVAPDGGDWKADMKALTGKKIGVPALGAAAQKMVESMLKESGVDRSAVTFLAVGAGPTVVSALQGKQVDAAIAFEPVLSQAVENGIAVQPFSIAKGEGPDFMQAPPTVVVSSQKFADANPAVLKKWLAALDEALAFAVDPANKDKVVKDIAAVTGQKPDAISTIYDANASGLTFLKDHGGVSITSEGLAGYDKSSKWAAETGQATAPVASTTWIIPPK